MKLKYVFLLLWTMPQLQARAQQLVWLDSSQHTTSFRGLSTAPDGSIWVSGSKGTIGLSTSGGQKWQWVNPEGMAQRDFRDIVGFSSRVAVAMAVDSPGLIIRTTDGGQHWKTVYTDYRSGIFLDDMAFGENGQGMVLGDPLEGRFVLAQTADSGKTWQAMQGPMAEPGEACFAASGTNMVLQGGQLRFVTGGSTSRLHTLVMGNKRTENAERLPLAQGNSTAGANAVGAMGSHAWVVGGNFGKPAESDSCMALFDTKTKKWVRAPIALPYQSGLAFQASGKAISCGTSGVHAIQMLPGGQLQLSRISQEGFHVVRAAAEQGAYYLAGSRGRIARIDFFQQ